MTLSVVIELMGNLLHDEEESRWHAALALGRMGPNAREAVPVLIDTLRDEDWTVGLYAAWALHQIGSAAGEYVHTLVDALKDEDWRVRWNAASALAQIGPDAREAVPALIELLEDENEWVRTKGADALKTNRSRSCRQRRWEVSEDQGGRMHRQINGTFRYLHLDRDSHGPGTVCPGDCRVDL